MAWTLDNSDWAELFDGAYRQALLALGAHEAAFDVAGKTIERLMGREKLNHPRPQNLAAYAGAVARNLASDELAAPACSQRRARSRPAPRPTRSARQRRLFDPGEGLRTSATDSCGVGGVPREALDRLRFSLSASTWQIFELHLEGRSPSEISAVVQPRVSTEYVRVEILRSLRHLCAELVPVWSASEAA